MDPIPLQWPSTPADSANHLVIVLRLDSRFRSNRAHQVMPVNFFQCYDAVDFQWKVNPCPRRVRLGFRESDGAVKRFASFRLFFFVARFFSLITSAHFFLGTSSAGPDSPTKTPFFWRRFIFYTNVFFCMSRYMRSSSLACLAGGFFFFLS